MGSQESSRIRSTSWAQLHCRGLKIPYSKSTGETCSLIFEKKLPFVSPQKNKEMGSVRLEFDFRTKGQPSAQKKDNTMGTYLDSIHSIRVALELPSLMPHRCEHVTRSVFRACRTSWAETRAICTGQHA